MVFSIIIILLVGLVAYFHYTQGFFSATISAMIAVMAALLAVSYHETVVNLLLKGKAADIAHAFVLCAIFAITYIVLRVIFDLAIPGNVRTPATADKIGAAVMGLVAGVFVTGIFAIAAQMLPFGPTLGILGYSRYATMDSRDVVVPSAVENSPNLDSKMHDELVETSITGDADSRAKQKGLLLPVDDWVLDAVYHVSAEGGSLAGDRTLASVHPDYLQELFGERLGQQDGGRRSALIGSNNDMVSVAGVYSAPSLPAADSEVKELRKDFKAPAEIKADHDHQILIVRISVRGNATDDEDGIFRFSTGAVRLVAHGKDFYPIGLLENASTVLVNKPDDFLFLNTKAGDAAFDAVFLVDADVIVGGKLGSNQVAQDTFVAVKRFALLNLSGQTINETIPAISNGPLRPPVLLKQLKLPPAPVAAARTAVAPSPIAVPTPAPVPATPAEPAKPVMTATGMVSSTLSFPIGCKTDNNDDPNVTVAGGTIALKGGNIAIAQVNPIDVSDLAKGDSQLKELAVPDGYKVVQVSYSTTGDAYAWVSQVGAIQVTDSNNNAYKANGVIVRLNQGTDKVMVRYDMNHTQFAVPSIGSGTPRGTTFLFVIRSSTHLASLQIGNDAMPISIDVP